MGFLLGDKAGRTLASAWRRLQGKLGWDRAGLGGVVSTPWPGPQRVGGAAPASLNAMLLVLCTDCSSLELRLGPVGMVPTRVVDWRVGGVCGSQPVVCLAPPEEAQLRRECPRPAGFLGALRASSCSVSQGPRIAESVCLLDRYGTEAGKEGFA